MACSSCCGGKELGEKSEIDCLDCIYTFLCSDSDKNGSLVCARLTGRKENGLSCAKTCAFILGPEIRAHRGSECTSNTF